MEQPAVLIIFCDESASTEAVFDYSEHFYCNKEHTILFQKNSLSSYFFMEEWKNVKHDTKNIISGNI